MSDPQKAGAEEERILRLWTPLLLRTILATSIGVLVMGLAWMALSNPASYVEQYARVKAGQIHPHEPFFALLREALRGDPHALLWMGLLLLTLVPLARVVFCFLLFVRVGDRPYIAFTAYVLLGLAAGVLLGRL